MENYDKLVNNTTVWNLHQRWNYILEIRITYTFCFFDIIDWATSQS